jgi:hypothetical protein
MHLTEFRRKEESIGVQLKMASEMERNGKEGSAAEESEEIGRPLKMLSIRGT